jgi:2-hydroxyacyl-CoA lyase 1
VIPDEHPLSVGAARSHALKEADVIFLMGARLNWIMHYGLAPRFAKDVRIVQLDLAGDAISTNVPAEVGLVGDGKAIVGQLNAALGARQWFYPADTRWRTAIAEKAAANAESIAPMTVDDSVPTNYYRVLKDIREWVPRDAVIVSEGANTMDIGRTQLPNFDARKRLDAGTYGTMGVGFGFAIAAAVVNPGEPVIVVEGDSAFGFSGMECETICRHNLPVKMVVLNNGGIGASASAERVAGRPLPPGVLMEGARYDKVMEAFGGRGFYVEDPRELKGALAEAMAFDGPACVNVRIHPAAGRKPQQFGWLTT